MSSLSGLRGKPPRIGVGTADRGAVFVRHRGRAWLAALVLAVMVMSASFGRAMAEDLRFHTLSNVDGLPQNTVSAVTQDAQGRIVLATGDGLAFYDGAGFDILRRIDDRAGALPDNYVHTLLRDRDGHLWVGTYGGGLARFDRDGSFIETIAHAGGAARSLPADDVEALTQDAAGNIWVATRKGVAILPLDRAGAPPPRPEPAFLGATSITTLLADGPRLWAGTDDGRIARCDLADGGCVWSPPPPSGGPAPAIRTLHLGHDGTVWLGTAAGLARWDGAKARFVAVELPLADVSSEEPIDVRALLDDGTGHLWIGSDRHGLLSRAVVGGRVERHRHERHKAESPSSDSIRSLSLDHSGVVWAGTSDRGVFRFLPDGEDFHVHRPSDTPGTGSDMIWSLAEEDDGTLLIGTSQGGGRFDPRTGHLAPDPRLARIQAHLRNDDLRVLLIDGDDLWVGTGGGGLARLRGPDGDLDHWTRDDPDPAARLPSNTVRLLLKDNRGALWIGTNKGLARLDPGQRRLKLFPADPEAPGALRHDRIRALRQDTDGTILVGTSGGFSRHRPATDDFVTVTEAGGALTDDDVRAIRRDGRGRLWLGTGSGIVRVDRDGTRRFLREGNGLENQTIYCALPETGPGRADFVWFSTNFGLYRHDAATGRFTGWFAGDGLPNNEFNFNACLAGRSGTFWFGGVDGFVGFTPASVGRDDTPARPRLVVTATDDRGRTRVLDPRNGPLTLAPDDQRITFTVEALHYRHPDRNQIRTRLIGLDPEPIVTRGARREIGYTNLAAGPHVFEVGVANGSGVWSDPITFAFLVPTPAWRTPLALAAYAAAVCGIGFAGHRLRARRLYRRAEDLTRIVGEKTAALEASHHALEEMIETRARFYRRAAHELRTPLTVVRATAERLVGDRAGADGPVMTALEQGIDRVLRLTDQMIDATRTTPPRPMSAAVDLPALLGGQLGALKVLGAQRGIAVTLGDIPPASVGIDDVALLDIVSNLVANAIRYTPSGGAVRVAVTLADESLILEVADTGPGLDDVERVFEPFVRGAAARDRDDGRGLGLDIVRDAVRRCGGSLDVSQARPHGAIFTVALPLQPLPAPEPATPEPEPSADVAAPGEGGRPIVLLVEDDDLLAACLEETLARHYEVRRVDRLSAARAALAAETPDAVLSDLALPDGNGLELLDHVRSDLAYRHLIFVVMTASIDDDMRLTALKGQVDDYLIKPFSFFELTIRIENLFARRDRLTRRRSRAVAGPATEIEAREPEDEFVDRLVAIVDEKLSDPDFSVAVAAGCLGLSIRQLQRKIAQTIDLSFSALVTARRIRRAEELLAEGKTVKFAALSVGFSDPGYFSTLFKKHTGRSPSKIRLPPTP